jgi:hypothetical protein
MATLGGETVPGMKADKGGIFWPHGKVEKRILDGPDDDVAAYYFWLASEYGRGPKLKTVELPTPTKKSWLHRVLGRG